MKRILGVVLFSVIVCAFGRCVDNESTGDYRMKISNRSDDTVVLVSGFIIQDGDDIPTTCFPDSSAVRFSIFPRDYIAIYIGARRLNLSYGDSLALYFFNPDTIASYNWYQIKQDKKYLERRIIKFPPREDIVYY